MGSGCKGSATTCDAANGRERVRTCQQQLPASSRSPAASSRWPTRPRRVSRAKRGSPGRAWRIRSPWPARPTLSQSCGSGYPATCCSAASGLPVVATGQEHLAAAGGISCIGCAAEECDPSLVRAHGAYGGGGAAAVPQPERAVVCARHEHVVVQPGAAPSLGGVRPVRDKRRCLRRLRVNHCDSAAGGDA